LSFREPVGKNVGFDPAAKKSDCLLTADSDAGFLELGRRCGLLEEMKTHLPRLCEASRVLLEAACP
jgi:hypothetical protein